MGRLQCQSFLWLNDVFDIHRNEEAIEWIQQEADGYEKGLKTLSGQSDAGEVESEINEE